MSWINSPFIKSNIYFNDLKIINNKVEASCKICRKKIIAGISSSSNLRRHYKTVQCTLYSVHCTLYSVHHTKLDEYDRVKCEHNENSKKRQLQEPSELSYTKKIKQSSLVQLSIEKSTTISHVETEKLLLKFLINIITPISIVNNKDFKEYVRGNYLNLSYKFILSNMILYIGIYISYISNFFHDRRSFYSIIF